MCFNVWNSRPLYGTPTYPHNVSFQAFPSPSNTKKVQVAFGTLFRAKYCVLSFSLSLSPSLGTVTTLDVSVVSNQINYFQSIRTCHNLSIQSQVKFQRGILFFFSPSQYFWHRIRQASPYLNPSSDSYAHTWYNVFKILNNITSTTFFNTLHPFPTDKGTFDIFPINKNFVFKRCVLDTF